ncbi:L10-interacting MYB domain-containing protein-like [Papaver somniferum]|uniref:L10-interacting MYB domain-containing protein-like n=1 Tax=Papaver somniferum TaxID=3469 RepID=UPI000E700089|nr:L10-interacting MYB domain-containing protein-like [Papaver somniferum]XP_026406727.1 L10-interacting MYB domain-containing protein-like [Papaver somniferum]
MDNDQLSINGNSKDEEDREEKNDEEENDDEESKKNNEAGKITFRNAPEFRRDFINYCLEEVNYSRSIGSTLKIPSWEKIGVKLSEKYGYPMKNKKLRNHWDYLKKQYMSWNQLLSLLGHGNDDVETTNFNCPKEQWDEISKKVKNANHFKEKGLEDADLLKCLFGDISFPLIQPLRTSNVEMQPLAVTSAPLDTLASEDSEQPARITDTDWEPSCQDVSEDTMDTSNSQELMKKTKRRRIEASSNDTVKGKGNYPVETIGKQSEQKEVTLMERQQRALEKQEIILKKLQKILEKQQSVKEKKESVPVDFLKSLENLKDAGHITNEDALEVEFKVSELSGWQKLFVNLPTTERRVSYVNKLLGKQ